MQSEENNHLQRLSTTFPAQDPLIPLSRTIKVERLTSSFELVLTRRMSFNALPVRLIGNINLSFVFSSARI